MSSPRKYPSTEHLEPYKWKPGQTGNPFKKGEHSLMLHNRIKELTGGGMEMIDVMVRLMRGQKFDKFKYPPKYDIIFEAAKWLAERLWGKEPIKLLDGSGNVFELQRLLYVELTKHKDVNGVFDVPADVATIETTLKEDGPKPPPDNNTSQSIPE